MPPVPVLGAVRRGIVNLGSTLRPDGYHGAHERSGFFEGWYVKLVSEDRTARLAVIPGIFLGLEGSGGRNDEAFVQVLDGATGRSWYERYDATDFHAATGRFDVAIGPNRFSAEGVTLDLPESGLRGRVEFTSPFDAVARDAALPGDHGLVRLGSRDGGVPRRRLVRSRPRGNAVARRRGPRLRRRSRLHREGLGPGVPHRIRLDADQPLRHAGRRASSPRSPSSRGAARGSAASSSGSASRAPTAGRRFTGSPPTPARAPRRSRSTTASCAGRSGAGPA